MEAVDVFSGVHTLENHVFVDVLRQGKLDQDAVDGIVPVELLDLGQQLLGGYGAGNREFAAVDAQLLAGLRFHVDVG